MYSLPSLLEEMKDPWLLPFLLPNIFEIAKTQTKDEFSQTLPALQPLFALTDPPQNMLSQLTRLILAFICCLSDSDTSPVLTSSSTRQPTALHRKNQLGRLQRT
jgi:hypothetical protein